MSDKKRLFVIGDAPVAPTGFGRVAEAVLDRLYESGEWSIKQLGINYFDEDHDKPYRIFSATAGNSNPYDFAGVSRVEDLYKQIDPDVTLVFQDLWHIENYIKACPDMRGLVAYFPVDSPNLKSSWTATLGLCTEVCTYTRFGAEEVSKSVDFIINKVREAGESHEQEVIRNVTVTDPRGQALNVPAQRLLELKNPDNINIIPHGVESDSFYEVDKTEARREIGLDPDMFIVGNVNRNQSRKRLDLTLRAFAEFAEGKDDVRLLFHDPLRTPEGWDLRQLATEYYKVDDKVILSNERLNDEGLNYVYNSVDVMVNTSGGEGWGLTNFESAMCKKAQVVPNWSATKEIWEGSAELIDVVSVRHEDSRVNTAQCCVSEHHLAEILNRFYHDREYLNEVAEKCYAVTQKEEYKWDVIAAQFEEVLNRAYEQQYVAEVDIPLEDLR